MPSPIAEMLRAQAAAMLAETEARARALNVAADQLDTLGAGDPDAHLSMVDAAKLAGVGGKNPARSIRDALVRDGVKLADVCGASVIRRGNLLAWLASRAPSAALGSVEVDYENVVARRSA